MMIVHSKHTMNQPNCAALGPSAISIKMSAGCADQATKVLKVQNSSSHLSCKVWPSTNAPNRGCTVFRAVTLIHWISDILSQGYTDLQNLVNCLDHRDSVFSRLLIQCGGVS